MPKSSLLIVATLGLLLVAAGSADAALIVSPNGYASSTGGFNNGFPFNISDGFGISQQRYQQVYDASDFSSFSGSILITHVLFRPASDGTASPFSSTLPDIQINMSTTSATPGAPSDTFADNVGADDVIVFARGPLSLSSSLTPALGGTYAFDIDIILSTPFLYDPANGNLLLDVRNFGGGITTQFDGASAPTIGRVSNFDDDVNSATGFVDGEFGLVTQFEVEGSTSAVPEPGSLTVWGLGIVCLLAVASRKRYVPLV